MGSIRQLKNGNFVVSVYDTTGKRHRTRFDEKKYADAFVKKIESEKSELKLVSVGVINKRSTIDEAITDFMNSKTNLKDKSVSKYNRGFDLFNVNLSISSLVIDNFINRIFCYVYLKKFMIK